VTAAWVYVRPEPNLYTVGHYAPDGQWHAESDHDSPEGAAARHGDEAMKATALSGLALLVTAAGAGAAEGGTPHNQPVDAPRRRLVDCPVVPHLFS
jgi:hypothetical protein